MMAAPAVDRRNNTADDAWKLDIATRMERMEVQHASLKTDVDSNTAITQATQTCVRDLAASLDGVVKFSRRVETVQDIWASFGSFCWGLSKIAAGALIVWALIKYVVLEAAKK